jgi:S1-C subfamily serine protease
MLLARLLVALGLVLATAPLSTSTAAAAPAASPAVTLWTEGHPATHGVPGQRPDFVKLSETLGPAVVYIAGRVGGGATPAGHRFESDPIGGKSVGTGFIINKSGYILTNFHVIERTDEIRVKLADGRDFVAQVVGTDERTDVALLKIDVPQPLPIAPLGDSDKLHVGEWVIAIGNPYGEFERSVTAGIISAVGRNNVKPTGKEDLYANFIQTDAAINLGNSGGPGWGWTVSRSTSIWRARSSCRDPRARWWPTCGPTRRPTRAGCARGTSSSTSTGDTWPSRTTCRGSRR